MADSSINHPPPNVELRMPMAEFVAMCAMLMATNALGIDMMLPALPEMGAHFRVHAENERQLVIISYMLGFGISQLIYGPLTDRFGRRRVLFISLACYSVACVLCIFAPSFFLLLAARLFHGASAGGSRVIAVSTVRDIYAGRRMARIMSLVMMVFMVAPILAPSFGQAVLTVSDWRSIFWFLGFFSLVMFVWVLIRLQETLPAEKRMSFDLKTMLRNYGRVISSRQSAGYTIASGVLFGGLMSYVSSSEQLFHEVYKTGAAFPLWFAGAALAMTAANLTNSRLVERLGMRRIAHTALIGFIAISATHAFLARDGSAPFPVFYVLLLLSFFSIGLQGPNYGAIGMEPLGDLAGSGAALIGFASSFVSALIGGAIASRFNGTTGPIFLGHTLLGGLALIVVLITERGRLMGQREPTRL